MNKNTPIWRPFTNMKHSPDPHKVIRGNGVWLELENGQKIMDLISSWWVNVHGHAHPEIAEAIAKQAKTLEHVIFAGYSHEPAEKLANLLVQELPKGQRRIFFSDNGSTAVEVALKMAYQHWKNLGVDHKQRFLAFEGAYHGDTFGAMAAGSRSVFTQTFDDLFFEVDYLPYPKIEDGDEIASTEFEVLAKLEEKLVENHAYAAIILEPLVQGAGGMNMCRPEFLRALEQLAQKNDLIIIYDEVMTGFGRTGDWFASRVAGTNPDIVCMSKGITGGFMPLAVTSANDRIFESFYDDDANKTLYHGHSYTANPLGCAAAVASWQLTKQAESVFRNFPDRYEKFVEELSAFSLVSNIRNRGTILAWDLQVPGQWGYLNPVSTIIKERAHESGLLMRPLGNTMYLMPPYCITEEELSWAFERILALLKTL